MIPLQMEEQIYSIEQTRRSLVAPPRGAGGLVWGVMVKSFKSENHKNDDSSGSPKIKSKSYQAKKKQNHTTQLLGYSSKVFTAEMSHTS